VPMPLRLQDDDLMNVFYLHGFASSGQSSKAAFFAGKLRPYGVTLRSPDFNEPDFRSLTITRMIEQVGRELDRCDGLAVLIGSSLGALVALHVAARWPGRVTRLVLLAPAIDLEAARMSALGDRALDAWKASGETMVFHYAYGRMMPLAYDLYTDALQYDTAHIAVSVPAQVFQGRRDAAVAPGAVERWAGARAGVELHMLDDDHQLLGSLNYIWREMARFIGLAERQAPGDHLL